jgi:hypothetical protein
MFGLAPDWEIQYTKLLFIEGRITKTKAEEVLRALGTSLRQKTLDDWR